MGERIIYPLYPHLKGKKILVVESRRGEFIKTLKTNLVSQQEMVVEVRSGMEFIGFDKTDYLSEIMEKGEFDMALFHVAGRLDERAVLNANKEGCRVVVLERDLGGGKDMHGLADSYQRIKEAGILSCVKYEGDWQTTILEAVSLIAEELAEVGGS